MLARRSKELEREIALLVRAHAPRLLELPGCGADRGGFSGMMRRGGESADEEKARFKESRRFSKAVAEILGGPPDIVFEHVGQATFPTSV
jgi:hypothetical protein